MPGFTVMTQSAQPPQPIVVRETPRSLEDLTRRIANLEALCQEVVKRHQALENAHKAHELEVSGGGVY